LYRVASTGGDPVAVTKLAPGQSNHPCPSFLPDGHHFLYYASGGVFVATLDNGESKRLLSADTSAIYSTSGDLLFVRQGILLRQHFDPAKLQVSGDPVPIAEPINATNNIVSFSISDNGVLAYRTGSTGGEVTLAWVDRAGKLLETVATPGAYRGLDVSP